MCRWLAYLGPDIALDLVLLQPENSLLEQSRDAQLSPMTTNGDGFGIGWYGDLETPGVFRDTRPAWNDSNFGDLARHIRSGMFMAHVRATTGTAVQRSNCHPFRHGRWLFQHNGLVPEYSRMRRDLLLRVAPELFEGILGSTDSELLFHLALTYGLTDEPERALARTVGEVERLRVEKQIEDPLHFTVSVMDGERLFAVRYSSDKTSRSLHYSQDHGRIRELVPAVADIRRDATLVASEPLGHTAHWDSVPESSLLVAGRGLFEITDFVPE
jgi:predicted glutamine amidotransferase